MPPKRSRETVLETMFELFDVEATFLHVQSILALFAAGLTSGCVIDSGEYSTTVYPVADGYHLTNASVKLSFGGSHVDDMLKYLLLDREDDPVVQNRLMDALSSQETIRAIKEKHAFITSTEMRKRPKDLIPYTLPDGQVVDLHSSDLNDCTERFFDPHKFAHLCESDQLSVPAAVHKSIMAIGIDLRRSLVGSIVLTGGNTMFAGLPSRLSTELRTILPGTMSQSIRVIAPPDRNNAIWAGGSILTSLSTFDDQWITGQDYDECGAGIVHQRCQVYL